MTGLVGPAGVYSHSMSPGLEPGWGTATGRAALNELVPDAAPSFHTLTDSIAVDPSTAARIRHACAGTLGLAPLPGELTDAATADRPMEDFAVQFSTDVSALDLATRDAFVTACGDDVFGTVQTVYVADMAPRVGAVLDALFGKRSDWGAPVPEPVDAMELWASVEEFLRVVNNLHSIDPVVTEIVRLRGAREHNCRLCRSLRSRPALEAGATEEVFDSIDTDGQPGLSDRARAALALTDAIIWTPAHLPAEMLEDIRARFTPLEAVELCLDVMRNASNKIAVALGADDPHVESGTEVYEIGEDGVAHYGLDAPDTTGAVS